MSCTASSMQQDQEQFQQEATSRDHRFFTELDFDLFEEGVPMIATPEAADRFTNGLCDFSERRHSQRGLDSNPLASPERERRRRRSSFPGTGAEAEAAVAALAPDFPDDSARPSPTEPLVTISPPTHHLAFVFWGESSDSILVNSEEVTITKLSNAGDGHGFCTNVFLKGSKMKEMGSVIPPSAAPLLFREGRQVTPVSGKTTTKKRVIISQAGAEFLNEFICHQDKRKLRRGDILSKIHGNAIENLEDVEKHWGQNMAMCWMPKNAGQVGPVAFKVKNGFENKVQYSASERQGYITDEKPHHLKIHCPVGSVPGDGDFITIQIAKVSDYHRLRDRRELGVCEGRRNRDLLREFQLRQNNANYARKVKAVGEKMLPRWKQSDKQFNLNLQRRPNPTEFWMEMEHRPSDVFEYKLHISQEVHTALPGGAAAVAAMRPCASSRIRGVAVTNSERPSFRRMSFGSESASRPLAQHQQQPAGDADHDEAQDLATRLRSIPRPSIVRTRGQGRRRSHSAPNLRHLAPPAAPKAPSVARLETTNAKPTTSIAIPEEDEAAAAARFPHAKNLAWGNFGVGLHVYPKVQSSAAAKK